MIDTTLLAFIGISLLLSVTPGPDMAVVTKNALAHGRRGVILTTTETAMFEWCQTAERPEFKKINALAKESPP